MKRIYVGIVEMLDPEDSYSYGVLFAHRNNDTDQGILCSESPKRLNRLLFDAYLDLVDSYESGGATIDYLNDDEMVFVATDRFGNSEKFVFRQLVVPIEEYINWAFN